MHPGHEAKEHVEIKAENQTLATITLQNYRLYLTKLPQATGTAQVWRRPSCTIYKLGGHIPTNMP